MSNVSSETITFNGKSLLHINMSNVTKLTASNYIMWSRQVHALLHGYGLSHYLDPSRNSPDRQITVNNVVSENPEYEVWNRQDQLIYSALIGALSLNVQPTVSRSNTSAAVWITLAETYAKPSRGHIKQLQHQIKQWKKETRTIDEYVLGLTNRFDQLALIGKIIDHEDQVDYILGGLPEDYKSVVDQMEGRDVAQASLRSMRSCSTMRRNSSPLLLLERFLSQQIMSTTTGTKTSPRPKTRTRTRTRINHGSHSLLGVKRHVLPDPILVSVKSAGFKVTQQSVVINCNHSQLNHLKPYSRHHRIHRLHGFRELTSPQRLRL